MKLSHIVPWGRTLDEYQKMFMLSDEDLQKASLGVAMVLLRLMQNLQICVAVQFP